MKRFICKVLISSFLISSVLSGYSLMGTNHAEAATLAKEIASKVMEKNMTEVEKLITLHDYLIYHTNYDYGQKRNSYNGNDVLKGGYGICEGYAKAFQLLCEEVGITCEIVTGTGNGQPHAWNKVKLNDGWYNVDTTWDDPINAKTHAGGGYEGYSYFLVSTAVLKKDHVWNNSKYSNKEGKKYLYYGQYVLEDGIPVAVKPSAFSEYDFGNRISEITLPATIKEIGKYAFWDNKSLSKITLPAKLELIDEFSFSSCANLQTVIFKSQNTIILDGAFNRCSKLVSIDLSVAVKEIGSYVFKKCTSLKTVKMDDSITMVGADAFANTPWMKNQNEDFIIIGDGVLIGDNLMDYSHVVIPDTVKVISGAFADQVLLNEISIPESVTRITGGAFKGTSLSTVVFPNTVKEIGDDAFSGCNSLKEIQFPANLDRIGNGAFYNCNQLAQINLPEGLTSIGMNAFSRCNSLDNVIIPNSVTNLSKAFDETAWFMNYPEDFIIVGDSTLLAYKGTKSSIVIPDKVNSMAAYAFYSNMTVNKVTLPASLDKIPDGAFNSCGSLESIVIPEGVKEIGEDVFFCTQLKKITIPGTVKIIGDRAFNYCSSLEAITIKNGVELIGNDVFKDTKINNISLPKSIKQIGWNLFPKYCDINKITVTCSKDSYSGKYAYYYGAKVKYV